MTGKHTLAEAESVVHLGASAYCMRMGLEEAQVLVFPMSLAGYSGDADPRPRTSCVSGHVGHFIMSTLIN